MDTLTPAARRVLDAAAELPESGHPARQAISDQKRWLRDYLRGLAGDAGAPDPGALADELLLLHEGATVLNGLAAVPDPVGTARRMALRALERAGVAGVD